MNNITFNLTSDLVIENGVNGISLVEIGDALQKFTTTHLYIDQEGKLRGVDDVLDILYSPCDLNKVYKGYELREKATDRYIHVFSKVKEIK